MPLQGRPAPAEPALVRRAVIVPMRRMASGTGTLRAAPCLIPDETSERLEVTMKRTCWVTAAVASIAALALSGAYQPVAAQKGGHGGGGGGGGVGGGSTGGAAVGGGGVAGGGSIHSGGRAFTGSAPRASVSRGHISGGDGRHV